MKLSYRQLKYWEVISCGTFSLQIWNLWDLSGDFESKFSFDVSISFYDDNTLTYLFSYSYVLMRSSHQVKVMLFLNDQCVRKHFSDKINNLIYMWFYPSHSVQLVFDECCEKSQFIFCITRQCTIYLFFRDLIFD